MTNFEFCKLRCQDSDQFSCHIFTHQHDLIIIEDDIDQLNAIEEEPLYFVAAWVFDRIPDSTHYFEIDTDSDFDFDYWMSEDDESLYDDSEFEDLDTEYDYDIADAIEYEMTYIGCDGEAYFFDMLGLRILRKLREPYIDISCMQNIYMQIVKHYDEKGNFPSGSHRAELLKEDWERTKLYWKEKCGL